MIFLLVNRGIYVVRTPTLITSEGGSCHLTIDKVRDDLSLVYATQNEPVIELILYRMLRLLRIDQLIPHVKLFVYKVVKR